MIVRKFDKTLFSGVALANATRLLLNTSAKQNDARPLPACTCAPDVSTIAAHSSLRKYPFYQSLITDEERPTFVQYCMSGHARLRNKSNGYLTTTYTPSYNEQDVGNKTSVYRGVPEWVCTCGRNESASSANRKSFEPLITTVPITTARL